MLESEFETVCETGARALTFLLTWVKLRLTGPGGVKVERSLGVRKVAGSIPSCDIPKVVKRWYK